MNVGIEKKLAFYTKFNFFLNNDNLIASHQLKAHYFYTLAKLR